MYALRSAGSTAPRAVPAFCTQGIPPIGLCGLGVHPSSRAAPDSTIGWKALARARIYSHVSALRVIEGGILYGSYDPGESGRPA